MIKLKSFAAGLILAVLSLAPAFAQGIGQLQPQQVWGNPTGSQNRGQSTKITNPMVTPGATETMKATQDGVNITDVPLPVIYPATPVTATTLQAAITAACSLPHAIVQVPVGVWSIDTTSSSINVTCGIRVTGSGASVAGTTGGTILQNTAAANDLFNVTTPQTVTIERLGMVATVTKSAGTVAVRLNNSSTSESHQTVQDNDIQGFCNSIEIDNSFNATIRGNYIYSTTCAGIIITQPNSADQGNNLIEDNKIWDVSGTAGATDCILWNRGSGTRIHHNRCLGAFNYGLHIKFDKTFGNDGALIADGNTFEVQKLSGIYLERTSAAQTAGTTIGQMVFSNNFIQSITPGGTGSFNVTVSGGSPWVISCVFTGNTIQNSITPSNNGIVEVDGGSDCNISNNVIDGTSGTGGIRVTGNSTNNIVANNLNPNTTAATKYGLNSSTTLIDATGMTVANLPTVANGSFVYTSDGCAANPITGGCSGAMAMRVNGAWVAAGIVKPRTQQRLTSGTNATYTTPSSPAPSVLKTTCWGSGAGGGGSAGATTGGGTGGAGNPSCFGTNATACTSPLVQANGGVAGQGGGQSGSLANPAAGGAGGSGGTGDDGFNGFPGGSSFATPAGNGNAGANGGGPGGGAGGFGAAGSAGTKPGGGGGGAGSQGAGFSGGAGAGSGEMRWKLITAPAASYFYTIGAGGTAGSAGTGGTLGFVGGVGGPGYCTVDEFYQ